MAARVQNVEVSSQAAQTEKELADFRKMLLTSRVVMNRHLGPLHTWICGRTPLFVTFHKQVSSGMRLPEDNAWDAQRASAENTVNAGYFSDLNIGALSVDGHGINYYGNYTVLLKDEFVRLRTTFFEENPFIFNERMHIYSGQPCPAGYRADWDRRGDLAIAKLGKHLRKGMGRSEFSDLLIKKKMRGTEGADFIEAHIFGPLHVKTISHVSGPAPKRREDKVLWNAVTRAIEKLVANGWSVQ